MTQQRSNSKTLKPYVSINLRLDPDVYETLKHIAETEDRSINAELRRRLRQGLKLNRKKEQSI